jgi:predicted permease
MLAVILTIALSTAAGVWAERRWGGRAGAAARRSLLLVLYTLIPFVVFFNLARVHLGPDVSGGVAIGWVALGLAALAAWAISRYGLDLPRPARGAAICSTLVANTGYLGLPLTVVLLGADRLGEAVVYDTLVSAPALLLAGFATGAAFGTRAGEGVRGRVVAFFTRNPPLFAAIAAVIAPASLAPDALVDASRIAVIAILPLGFFAVGAALEEEAEEGELRVPPPLTGPVSGIILTRLVLAPGLLLALSLPFIDLPGPYLLLAAMPCGINTMIVAHAYGLDVRITAEALAWTTLIALAAALAATLVI